MSESLPFVETIVGSFPMTVNPNAVRAALHALIAHCRQPQPKLMRVSEKGDIVPVCAETEPPKSSPAPASASARAEAMERLHREWGIAQAFAANDDRLSRLANAVADVIDLPEPDPMAGLRDLTGWIADHSFCNGETRQRLLDEGELLDEIRRRIAAWGSA